MIVHDVEQGSEQWHKLRLGIPTASKFGEIISPKKLQPSKSAETYMYKLLAEWIIGQPCDMGSNKFMDRGTGLEPEARKMYELIYGVRVKQIGFCTTDDGRVGYSPDGFIGENGLLEIKNPMAPTHVKYLLDPQSLYEEYKLQVQGGLFVTGRDWADIISHNPAMPMAHYRIEPDSDVIRALAGNLMIFTQQLEIFKQRLIEKDIEPYELIAEREQREVDAEFNEVFPE